jgi:hypothetical protein
MNEEELIKETQEVLNSLFELYKEITGSRWSRPPDAKYVIEELASRHHVEHRFGSKWTHHSKLEIYWSYKKYPVRITAEFYHNMQS